MIFINPKYPSHLPQYSCNFSTITQSPTIFLQVSSYFFCLPVLPRAEYSSHISLSTIPLPFPRHHNTPPTIYPSHNARSGWRSWMSSTTRAAGWPLISQPVQSPITFHPFLNDGKVGDAFTWMEWEAICNIHAKEENSPALIASPTERTLEVYLLEYRTLSIGGGFYIFI